MLYYFIYTLITTIETNLIAYEIIEDYSNLKKHIYVIYYFFIF